MSPSRPHVVIIGGGFAGLWAARALAKAPVRITLIDRRNHHLFQPLLYQVATAGLSAPDIAAPLRHILRRQANVEVRLAEVTRVEPESRRLQLGDAGSLDYDYLLLATGATHAYFGHDEWAKHACALSRPVRASWLPFRKTCPNAPAAQATVLAGTKVSPS